MSAEVDLLHLARDRDSQMETALGAMLIESPAVLGRQLRVHADSRNLDDVLPAFDIQSLPVKLQSGEVIFDGTVAEAARLLNMRRTTLVEKLRKYRLCA